MAFADFVVLAGLQSERGVSATIITGANPINSKVWDTLQRFMVHRHYYGGHANE